MCLEINFDNEAYDKASMKKRTPGEFAINAQVVPPVHHDPVDERWSKTSQMNTDGASFQKHILLPKISITSWIPTQKTSKSLIFGRIRP